MKVFQEPKRPAPEFRYIARSDNNGSFEIWYDRGDRNTTACTADWVHIGVVTEGRTVYTYVNGDLHRMSIR